MERTIRRSKLSRRSLAAFGACALLGGLGTTLLGWRTGARRLRIVVPGRLLGGAWQDPATLRDLIRDQRIRTILTLTAINRDDPKYVGQSRVVRSTGVDWIIVPMRGSTATPEQMACAADLMADPARQPVYFHCVAGHHRTGLAQAAYLIRYAGYDPRHAWDTVARLPWARPGAPADERDRALIAEFARVQPSIPYNPRAAEPQAIHAANR